MEQGKSMLTIATITALMLLYAGGASAISKPCFDSCVHDCYAAGGWTYFCPFKCAYKCRKGVFFNRDESCTYACAINQCAQFGNDVDKVDDCVNNCSNAKCKK